MPRLSYVWLESGGMLEGVSTESTQASVTYVTETSQGEETVISLQEEAGASLLPWTVPYSFSAILISCPEMKTGENYVLSIGDTTETISLSDIVTTAGAESGSSGAMPGGAMPGGTMPGGAMSLSPDFSAAIPTFSMVLSI
jgi:hypothetical protein